jgi:hypothetical protein
MLLLSTYHPREVLQSRQSYVQSGISQGIAEPSDANPFLSIKLKVRADEGM